jgi:hypothetical protein
MKKHLASRFWSCLLVSLVFNSAFAQPNKQIIPASFTSPNTTTVTSNTKVAAATSAVVNAKVQRAFGRFFQEGTTPYWSVDSKCFIAKFKLGDRCALASFDKNGHLYYTILYGSAKHLPLAEKSLVQSNYRDYEITFTQEMITDEFKLWLVSLENCKNILKVRVMNGEIDELEHLQKSK